MIKNEHGEKSNMCRRIRTLRESMGFSQEELAVELQRIGFDCDRNFVKRVELGDQYINEFAIQAFAKIFNVTYEYLIDGKE